jgi:hypothetical protein
VANRTIKDAEDRVWTCVSAAGTQAVRGRDVVITCTTPSIPAPVTLTVGWNWEKMAEKGLARLIVQAANDARRAA